MRAPTGQRHAYDAVVVGSGPNGLAAAITLARAGRRVAVFEAAETPGGGLRTAELTLPGVHHDVCAAFFPFAASPFFAQLPLREHGLEWLVPEVPAAHPLAGGEAAVLYGSLDRTCASLGRDGPAYRGLVGLLARRWRALAADVLKPVQLPPADPFLLACFGLRALLPAALLARLLLRTARARALIAGLAAHSGVPLEQPLTASFALLLAAAAHASGWPAVRGGSQCLAEALVSYLESLGGEVFTRSRIDAFDQLPPARAVLLDLTVPELLRLCGDRLPPTYRRALERFRPGPAVFKLDLALAGPVPWLAEECRRSAVVHIGGTLEEIAAAEREVACGRVPATPYVIVGQQSLLDPTRAPAGKHTLWAYCHLPRGSNADMTEAIESQVERAAPGFRQLILARHSFSPADLQQYNANYHGGDTSGGWHGGRQLFLRPVARLNPYRTPLPGVFVCSSSTPPGAGVHGMCGYYAARAALRYC